MTGWRHKWGACLGTMFEDINPGHFGHKKSPPGGKKSALKREKHFKNWDPFFGTKFGPENGTTRNAPPQHKIVFLGPPKRSRWVQKVGPILVPKSGTKILFSGQLFQEFWFSFFQEFSVSFFAVLVPLFDSSMGLVCCLVAPRLRCGCSQVTL